LVPAAEAAAAAAEAAAAEAAGLTVAAAASAAPLTPGAAPSSLDVGEDDANEGCSVVDYIQRPSTAHVSLTKPLGYTDNAERERERDSNETCVESGSAADCFW
jgi:hypothetical protein